MVTTVIILSVILVVASYVVWNLLRKVERLEDTANDYAEYLYNISEIIQQSNERIQELDRNQMFSSDDEIGFFFKEVQNIQNILNSINTNESTTEEETRS